MDRSNLANKLPAKRTLLLVLLITIAALAALVCILLVMLRLVEDSEEAKNYEDTHIHAAFQVYVDGELQDYSGSDYMHLGVCGADEAEPNFDDVTERVHLHENVGDVAHVHATETTWRDLFVSLGIDNILPARGAEESYAFLNGKPDLDLYEQEINAYDSAVFIFGESPDLDTINNNELDRVYIEEAEAIIESCGTAN